MLIVISVMMMRKLRLRFHSMYTDHGLKLWTIYILQAFSLLCLTADSILEYYTGFWETLWDGNKVLASICDILLNIVGWIIPMIT